MPTMPAPIMTEVDGSAGRRPKTERRGRAAEAATAGGRPAWRSSHGPPGASGDRRQRQQVREEAEHDDHGAGQQRSAWTSS